MIKHLFFLLIIILGCFIALSAGNIDFDWINTSISLIALIVAILSAFKKEIFPFDLEVLANEVILAPSSGPSHDSLALLFPIVFINRGSGTGVIEGISIKVTDNGNSKLYMPIAEIDYIKYLTGKRMLHAESMLGSFAPFTINGEESIKKYILFSQEDRSEDYPFSKWQEGEFTFEIYVKHSNCKAPIKIANMTYVITDLMLLNYFNGSGACLSPSSTLKI